MTETLPQWPKPASAGDDDDTNLPSSGEGASSSLVPNDTAGSRVGSFGAVALPAGAQCPSEGATGAEPDGAATNLLATILRPGSDSEPEGEPTDHIVKRYPGNQCMPRASHAYEEIRLLESGRCSSCSDASPGATTNGPDVAAMVDDERRAKRRRGITKIPQGFGIAWFAALRANYGTSLLLLLFAAQHVLKGVVQQFQAATVMWVFRDYRVSGPRMQVYTSVSNSAWALKPLIGLVSDLVPVWGLHKAPYVVLASTVGVVCTSAIGFSTCDSMSVVAIVGCLFGMSLQASTCDLLSEAKYSEHLAEKPAFGPDLLTYVWGGISTGNIIAICSVGWLIQNFGPRSVFLACVAPSSAILYPTLFNYFEETPVDAVQQARVRAFFFKQKEVIWLCVLMFFCTVLLTITGATTLSHRLHFIVAVSVLLILLPSFHIVLRPEIAKVNTFFVLQAALGIGINGATFYFYTDKPEQFPEGPHFSAWFFTTTLGLVSASMSLLGLGTYNRYMKDWTYRSLILFCNTVVTCLSLMDIVMYTRTNVKVGIPDVVFVLGSSVCTIVIRQWQWMPGMVIMSQLCPSGMEATMFALLAGCANIGNTIADYIGAYVLEVLHVHPTGAADEGHQFDNLWKASAIATMMPAVTILLVPFLIPQAKQTDKLLVANRSSATAGSPLSKWLANRATRPGLAQVFVNWTRIEQHPTDGDLGDDEECSGDDLRSDDDSATMDSDIGGTGGLRRNASAQMEDREASVSQSLSEGSLSRV
mmetsp:Transcript_88860/g.153917  ORF Transcript_88860/g.153917 Transcript_88860/m.153917 type:complete len:758 (+) Transcript_88860:105-2378(+)